VKPQSNPESYFLFQLLKEKVDIVTVNYKVDRDEISGEFFSSSPSISTSPRFLCIVVLNISLTIISTIYFSYLLMRKTINARKEKLEEWGSLYFGGEWPSRRNEIYQKAGN
jgi:hypothetical protein